MGSRSKRRSRPVELLTPYEVAALLRVSRATVLRMARDGVIRSVRVGRGKAAQFRFARSEVEAYVGRRTA